MPFRVRNVSRSPHARGLRRRAVGKVKRTLWVGPRRIAPGRSITISDEVFAQVWDLLKTNDARGACEVHELNEDGGVGARVVFDVAPELPEVEEAPVVEETPVEPEPEPEAEDTPEEEPEEEDTGRMATVAEEALSEELTHAATAEADPEVQDPESNKVAEPEPEVEEAPEEEAKVYTKAELMSLRKDELHEVFKTLVGDQGPAPTKNEMANAIMARQE